MDCRTAAAHTNRLHYVSLDNAQSLIHTQGDSFCLPLIQFVAAMLQHAHAMPRRSCILKLGAWKRANIPNLCGSSLQYAKAS